MWESSTAIHSPYNANAPRYKYLWRWQAIVEEDKKDLYLDFGNCYLEEGVWREIGWEEEEPEDVGTLKWCIRMCETISTKGQRTTPSKVIDLIVSLSTASAEYMAAALTDELGVSNIHFISKVLEFRKSLLNQWTTMLDQIAYNVRGNRYADYDLKRIESLYTTFTGKTLEHQRGNLLQALREIPPSELLLAIMDSKKVQGNNIKGGCIVPSVAVDIEREDDNLYEKATILPSKTTSVPETESLIRIDTLPQWAQPAFREIETLNLVQSKVYNSAFNTSQNLLLSAPTGCGKTNVALLCMLQVFSHFLESRGAKGKVLYIAPMKALASEVTGKFTKALGPMGLVVSEATGDVQIARKELFATDVLVTTPEKLDVITRNSNSTGTQSEDNFLSRVSCLIIDEVHLLNDARGSVLEIMVARFFRLIEATQISRRIVAISATLPNWQDVARFLRVPSEHTYYFGPEYRHIPLEQVYYGVKTRDTEPIMIDICFEHVKETLAKDKKCIIFVHSRNDTIGTAMRLIDLIRNDSFNGELFRPNANLYKKFRNNIAKFKYEKFQELADHCISVHHAGMLRNDRDAVENMFKEGLIKVLVSTSTLAWGVNLPAHCVIIKGTFISGLTINRELNYLELTQMLGRAGRPQFDKSGLGIILTEHKNLNNCIRMLTAKVPIESQLHRNLENALNAEIALGAVSEELEALSWLQYTFLYIRIKKNPLAYGLNTLKDEDVTEQLSKMIHNAALNLDKTKLIRYNRKKGEFSATDLGRIAARYYVDYETIYNFAVSLKPEINEDATRVVTHDNEQQSSEISIATENIDEGFILERLCECKEYECLLYRNEETEELKELLRTCVYKPKKGINHITTKISLLLEAHINRSHLRTISLLSDLNYITQNTGRLLLAFFEVSVSDAVAAPPMGDLIYKWFLMFERQIWDIDTKPRCVAYHFCYPYHAMYDMEKRKCSKLPVLSQGTAARLIKYKLDTLLELNSNELADIVKSKGEGSVVHSYLRHVPYPKIEAHSIALTNRISKVVVGISIDIEWSTRWNGQGESFHVWICSETRIISKVKVELTKLNHKKTLDILVPLVMSQKCLTLKVFSCRWLGISVEQQLVLRTSDEKHEGYTNIMKILPVPTSVVCAGRFRYPYKFFNPLQSQMLPHCYYSDDNLLVGAPTGSGKTVIAEIAIFRLWSTQPKRKVVYIAPLKALAYERLKDWHKKFGTFKRVVEVTGDSHTSAKEIANSHIIVTTPEKWDGISRHWSSRKYVRSIGLLIIDEIHLLGESRGGVLEAIISRLSFMSKHLDTNVRIVCLSTALANSGEIADWLMVKRSRLFNFCSAVRPVACNIYIDGFPIKAYCPRMNSMNKPAFNTILKHDIDAPVLVFVSSRRQTRTTAQDFVGLLQLRSLKWASCNTITEPFIDENLNIFVEYGIGIHHAGLHDKDRSRIESMFLNGHIKVLVATSTLAWGVNLPAKIVIVKGTEYYDGKTNKYVDYSVTDIMQMVGRAGRKVQDIEAYAYIYTESRKVDFYKAFLFSPFPAESSFHEYIVDSLNSEIASGTVSSSEQALQYLKSTFLYSRMKRNPGHYIGMDILKCCREEAGHNALVTCAINRTLDKLQELGCISFMPNTSQVLPLDHKMIVPTLIGVLASQYYARCDTMAGFLSVAKQMPSDISIMLALRTISNAIEFKEVPLRHNEDIYNMQLSSKAIVPITQSQASDPHAKTFLLLQARLFELPMPIFDYNNDLKSVVDQIPRLLQAFIDLVACYRNFKNMQYLLMLYKHIVTGANMIANSMTFSSETDFAIDVIETIYGKKLIGSSVSTPGEWYQYAVGRAKEVDVVVTIGDIPANSSPNYLILGNDFSGSLYGYKKVMKSGRYPFRLKVDQLRGHLVIQVIFVSCTTMTYDLQKTIILSVGY